MQKFRDYIYCDEDRMNSYINQISELSKVETTNNYERTTEFGGNINLKIAKAGTTLNEKNSKSYTINSNPMENFINWAFDENNAINYYGQELTSNDKDNLIVLNGTMNIPEMGENIELINTVAKNTEWLNYIPISEEDKQKFAFIKESENVPILLEAGSNYIFNCNLKRNCIIGNSDDFLDNLNNEISIIGRVERVFNSDNEIEIFDLAKEIFKVNRTIRRRMDKETLEKSIICEKGPLVKIIPIVIYK